MPVRRTVRCKVCGQRLKAQKSREIRLCSQHDQGKFQDEPDTPISGTYKRCLRGHESSHPTKKYCDEMVQGPNGTEMCRQELIKQ